MSDAIQDFISGMPSPDKVHALENLTLQLPQVDIEIAHLVFGGMCARTGMIPAGVTMTGAQTEIDNICVLFGDITVTTDLGPKRLTGFHVLPAAKGFKRVGVAHSDTWWSTILRTDLTDIREIEDAMTRESDRLMTRRPALDMAQVKQIEGE
jgi:hypothetical protein